MWEESGIVSASGARATELLLLGDLDDLLREIVADPSDLAHPVRIVVPSRSLRDHLGSVLVRRRSGGIAGVNIQTLHAVALEILERAGEHVPAGDLLFPALVRREAEKEQDLRDCLGHLTDGYAAVAATVADLLDAGAEAAHADALDDLLAEARDPAAQRARAIVRVAAGIDRALRDWRIGRGANLLGRATQHLCADTALLPARALLIHGFADATGVATDLIEALLLRRRARIYLDRPPDPAKPGEIDLGIAFSERFTRRLESALRVVRPAPAPDPASLPRVELLRAPGASAEARAVAERIRALLDTGVPPESIAIVARALGSYVAPLRLHLGRLGIPFSGHAAAGPTTALTRRAHALIELLRLGNRASVDAWLDLSLPAASGDAAGDESSDLHSFDLRLALRARGAGRLAQVAGLDTSELSRGTVPLPVRRGFSDRETDGNGDEVYAARRSIPARIVLRAIERARDLCRMLQRWPAEAPVAAHFERLTSLLHTEIEWTGTNPAANALIKAAETTARSLPSAFPLAREDFSLLLARSLPDSLRPPFGGNGGGVQVLDVMEARGRTFDHLFVLGMNRDVFPRVVREDPLLPDALRARLHTLLPDLPRKRGGFDEERYLFAHLLSASPRATLSWQLVGDDQRPQAPSPLVERLLLEASAAGAHVRPPETVPCVHDGSENRPRTPYEQAVRFGLDGDRDRFEHALVLAATDASATISEHTPAPALAAGGRARVLRELDAGLEEIGPYFGFVGTTRDRFDPRSTTFYVTTMERMARCPWQTFLQRLLRIEAVPDPLEALPGIDPGLLGRVVHAALDAIVKESLAGADRDLTSARQRAPVSVRWPDERHVVSLLEQVAQRVIAGEGIALPGLGRVLARQARPHIEAIRAFDWPEESSEILVIGSEIEGTTTVLDRRGEERLLHFRADRADVDGDELLLTDYKTGKPLTEARTLKARRERLLRAIRKGEQLQGTAYALAHGAQHATGRYLFTKPDLEPDVRTLAVSGTDEEAASAFRHVASAVLGAWDEGCFFPRLVEPEGRKTPPACALCEVSQACLRADVQASRRLHRWVETARREAAASAAGRALVDVWDLHRKDEDENAGSGTESE